MLTLLVRRVMTGSTKLKSISVPRNALLRMNVRTVRANESGRMRSTISSTGAVSYGMESQALATVGNSAKTHTPHEISGKASCSMYNGQSVNSSRCGFCENRVSNSGTSTVSTMLNAGPNGDRMSDRAKSGKNSNTKVNAMSVLKMSRM